MEGRVNIPGEGDHVLHQRVVPILVPVTPKSHWVLLATPVASAALNSRHGPHDHSCATPAPPKRGGSGQGLQAAAPWVGAELREGSPQRWLSG